MEWAKIINGNIFETECFVRDLVYDMTYKDMSLNDIAKRSFDEHTQQIEELTKVLEEYNKKLADAESKPDDEYRKEFNESLEHTIQNYEKNIEDNDVAKKKAQDVLNQIPSQDYDDDFDMIMFSFKRELVNISDQDDDGFFKKKIINMQDPDKMEESYQWWKYCQIQSIKNRIIDLKNDIKNVTESRTEKVLLLNKLSYEIGLGPINF